jgi:vancomycin resistance protein VanW
MTKNFAKVLYTPQQIDQSYASWAEFESDVKTKAIKP